MGTTHEYKNTRNYKKNLGPNYCEVCGWSKVVTKHRIKPGRRGGKYTLGNVIILCPNCHALAELGEFSQYELFCIVQDRIRFENNYGTLITPDLLEGGNMARATVVTYTSDITGDPIDEEKAVEVRIKFLGSDKLTRVVDANEDEVKDLIEKGREEQRRGRKPSK